jgi:hypothetical protein
MINSMSIFKKKQPKRPIDNFNANYLHIKAMLYKTFTALDSLEDIKVARLDSGILTSADFNKFAAQATDYLLGERADVTIGNKGLAETIYNLPNIRPMVDAIRDWKYEKLNELLGTQWTDSEEAKHLAKIISQEDESIKHSEGYVEFMGNLRELRF